MPGSLDQVLLISLAPSLIIDSNSEGWQKAKNDDDSQDKQNLIQPALAAGPSLTSENVPSLFVNAQAQKNTHVRDHGTGENCAPRNPLLVCEPIVAQNNGNDRRR